MILTYEQCIERYQSDYKIKKELKEKRLFKIMKGLYSTKENYDYLEVIALKCPNAILTLDSAFFYHDLTDVIPEKYHLMTNKDAYKLSDPKIKQYYTKKEYLDLGKETMNVNGMLVCVYSKERLLVDLIRYKTKFSYDYYKEIIHNYRKIIYDLDIEAIEEYAYALPKSDYVLKTLQAEVF